MVRLRICAETVRVDYDPPEIEGLVRLSSVRICAETVRVDYDPPEIEGLVRLSSVLVEGGC